jgi:hypothetical protein
MTNPHDDAWEHSCRAVQEQARGILASIDSGAPETTLACEGPT